MSRSMRTVAVPLAGMLLMAGCATKGQLRQVQAQVDATRAQLEQEQAARQAADEQQAAQLAQLRTDLQAFRSDFDAKIVALEEGLKFIMPVHFAFDDASVRQQDMAALDRFAEIVGRHYQGATITVEGFADPAGSRSYNQALSAERADAVQQYLTGKNIAAQLRTVGYGEDRLVVPGAADDEPGAELNRRVVFVVEGAGAPGGITMALPRD